MAYCKQYKKECMYNLCSAYDNWKTCPSLTEPPTVDQSGVVTGYVDGGWLVEWGRASVYRKTKEEAYSLAEGINSGEQWKAVVIQLFRKEST